MNHDSVYRAIRDSFDSTLINQALEDVRQQYVRPSAVFRPSLKCDGDQWCALYGEDLQEGVAGFGSSPAQAMSNFDAAWNRNLSVVCDGAALRAAGGGK